MEWWTNMPGFEKFFWFFAIPFSLVFVMQLILTFIGLGDHGGDVDADTGATGDAVGPDNDSSNIIQSTFKLFTIKNVITFFTIFGWAGITLYNAGAGNIITAIASVIIALAVTLVVSAIFYFVIRLTESGNVSLKSTIGHIGKVYVPIPANESGIGKVHITVSGSFKEIDAVTPGEALTTDEDVLIIDVRDNDIVVVVKSEVKGW